MDATRARARAPRIAHETRLTCSHSDSTTSVVQYNVIELLRCKMANELKSTFRNHMNDARNFYFSNKTLSIRALFLRFDVALFVFALSSLRLFSLIPLFSIFIVRPALFTGSPAPRQLPGLLVRLHLMCPARKAWKMRFPLCTRRQIPVDCDRFVWRLRAGPKVLRFERQQININKKKPARLRESIASGERSQKQRRSGKKVRSFHGAESEQMPGRQIEHLQPEYEEASWRTFMSQVYAKWLLRSGA